MATLFNLMGIPLFDIGTVVAGIYVGYNNANGVDVGTLDDVLKYGPTIAATIITPLAMLIGRAGIRKIPSEYIEMDGGDIKLKEIPEIVQASKFLTYRSIGRETFLMGAKTALESLIGYGIGYAYAIGKFS